MTFLSFSPKYQGIRYGPVKAYLSTLTSALAGIRPIVSNSLHLSMSVSSCDRGIAVTIRWKRADGGDEIEEEEDGIDSAKKAKS